MPVKQISSIIILASILAACSSQEPYSRHDGSKEAIHQKQTRADAHQQRDSEVVLASNSTLKSKLDKSFEKKSNNADKTTITSGNATPKAKPKSRELRKLRAKVAPVMALQESSKQFSLPPADAVVSIAPQIFHRYSNEPVERENYQQYSLNPIQLVAQNPVSTFSVDVDTGSYTNVRRLLHEGRLPQHNAVRVEEFINYFSYQYPAATSRETPFSTVTEVGPNPWNANTNLLHIGIKGYEVSTENLPAANLVFLLDVSGSMNSPDKLPLLKNALKLLTNKMRAQDSVAIAVYAGASGTVLQPTAGNQKSQISAALQNLSAGGSTNGAAGIRLAYQLAQQSFIKNGINRVILATDGDFNVGTTNLDAPEHEVWDELLGSLTVSPASVVLCLSL